MVSIQVNIRCLWNLQLSVQENLPQSKLPVLQQWSQRHDLHQKLELPIEEAMVHVSCREKYYNNIIDITDITNAFPCFPFNAVPFMTAAKFSWPASPSPLTKWWDPFHEITSHLLWISDLCLAAGDTKFCYWVHMVFTKLNQHYRLQCISDVTWIWMEVQCHPLQIWLIVTTTLTIWGRKNTPEINCYWVNGLFRRNELTHRESERKREENKRTVSLQRPSTSKYHNSQLLSSAPGNTHWSLYDIWPLSLEKSSANWESRKENTNMQETRDNYERMGLLKDEDEQGR